MAENNEKLFEFKELPFPKTHNSPIHKKNRAVDSVIDSRMNETLDNPETKSIVRRCINKLLGIKKKKVKNDIKTWNILDNYEEEILVSSFNEKHNKLSFKQAGLAALFMSKKKKSVDLFSTYEDIPVEDDYKGVRIKFPLGLDNIKEVMDAYKENSIYL